LKLWHQAFRATASVIGTATTCRENNPIYRWIVEGLKLTLHGVTAEVNSLNFKSCPIHWGTIWRFGANQNHVDASYVIATLAVSRSAGFKKANFTNKLRVWVTKDCFSYPLEHIKLIVEAIWTSGADIPLLTLNRDTYCSSVVLVCIVGVEAE